MKYSGSGRVMSCFSSRNAALSGESRNVVKLFAVNTPVSCVSAGELGMADSDVLVPPLDAAPSAGMGGCRPAMMAAEWMAISIDSPEADGLLFGSLGSVAYLTNSRWRSASSRVL